MYRAICTSKALSKKTINRKALPMHEHTYTHLDIGEPNDVVICNDCGAFADSEDEVVHHQTCEPGSAKKWEEYYHQTPEEIAQEEQDDKAYGDNGEKEIDDEPD